MTKGKKKQHTLNNKDTCKSGVNMKSSDEYEKMRTCSEAQECIREWMNSTNYEEHRMPSDMFKFWYNAIYDDNITFVKEVLSSCNEYEKRLLLNGSFQFQNQCPLKATERNFQKLPCKFELPLFIAVHFQSKMVLNAMLETGVDPFQVDCGGNNIIHGMIMSSALEPENQYKDVYEQVMNFIAREDKKLLLFAENSDGFRPLEYASKMNEFVLMECILQTKGVYAFSRGTIGVYEQIYYDVTDYEHVGKGRYLKSPVWFVTHLTPEALKRKETRDVILSPTMMSWYKFKEESTSCLMYTWVFFRILFHVMVFIGSGSLKEAFVQIRHDYNIHYTCEDVINGTSVNLTNCERKVMLTLCSLFWGDIAMSASLQLVIVISTILLLKSVISGVLSFGKTYCTKKGLDRKIVSGGALVSTRFYDMAQFLLALSIVNCYIFLILDSLFYNHHLLLAGISHSLAVISFVCVILLNSWALLYFFQFLPHIGYFVLAVQQMVGETFKFTLIFMLFLFGFSEAFANVLFVNGFCDVPEFSGTSMSLYSTFTVMLNMVSFSEYVQSNISLAFVHVTYVMLVGVLLINFLIALMANSMYNVSEYRTILMILQRLHRSMLLEWKHSGCCCICCRRKRKQYLVKENGRLYLPCFVQRIMKNR